MAQNQTDTISTHTLSLKPLQSMSKPIRFLHSFSKPKQCSNLFPQEAALHIPTFNEDRRQFTPSFVLKADKKYYSANQEFEEQKFMEKIRKIKRSICNSNINKATPSSDFCQVCRISYSNYLQHIKKREHKNNIKGSEAHIFIQELVSPFNKRSHITKKTTKIKKQGKKVKIREKVKKNLEYQGNKERFTLLKQQTYSTN